MDIDKYICPECKSSEAVKIVYGYPLPETLKAWHNKKIELGGCVVTGSEPNRKCFKCDHQWKSDVYE